MRLDSTLEVREIPLAGGYVAIVDAADYDKVSACKWDAIVRSYTVYGRAYVSPDAREYLHRFLMDAPKGTCVDHIDGNGLNNRRCNLRLCQRFENNRNQKVRRTGTSIFKGVCKNGPWGTFRAQIGVNGRQITLGCHKTQEEAARAYDRAALLYFGAFARLNFPQEQQ